MEVSAPAGGALALSPAPVGGRRHHKLKLVKKKTVRKMLRKLGMKMRGGAGPEAAPVAVPAPMAEAAAKMGGAEMAEEIEAAPEVTAGRRRRRAHTKKTHRRSRGRSLFGVRY
jgi:hypothetical protein